MTGLSSTVFAMDLPSMGYDYKLPFFIVDGANAHIAPTPLARDSCKEYGHR
jgi:hypothetical protein